MCAPSHTATHGAFGALAFGIGTSEVEHVLATQTLLQKRAKNMKIEVRAPASSPTALSVGPASAHLRPSPHAVRHISNSKNPARAHTATLR